MKRYTLFYIKKSRNISSRLFEAPTRFELVLSVADLCLTHCYGA